MDKLEKKIKVFISYSWTSEEHKRKVYDLDARLKLDGIVTIIDAVELKPGHNIDSFMKQITEDPSIDKVLCVCDKGYQEKANSMSGGVGKEVRQFYPEVHGNPKQEKFLPLIFEYDTNKEACVPKVFENICYFDFLSNYEDAYNKLINFLKPNESHEHFSNYSISTNDNCTLPISENVDFRQRLKIIEKSFRKEVENSIIIGTPVELSDPFHLCLNWIYYNIESTDIRELNLNIFFFHNIMREYEIRIPELKNQLLRFASLEKFYSVFCQYGAWRIRGFSYSIQHYDNPQDYLTYIDNIATIIQFSTLEKYQNNNSFQYKNDNNRLIDFLGNGDSYIFELRQANDNTEYLNIRTFNPNSDFKNMRYKIAFIPNFYPIYDLIEIKLRRENKTDVGYILRDSMAGFFKQAAIIGFNGQEIVDILSIDNAEIKAYMEKIYSNFHLRDLYETHFIVKENRLFFYFNFSNGQEKIDYYRIPIIVKNDGYISGDIERIEQSESLDH